MNNYPYRSECNLEIYRERPFKFIHHQKAYNERQSEDLITSEARTGTQSSKYLDSYSVQLFLKALYENFVYRPFRSVANFAFVTKTIFYSPSKKNKENVLISN